MYSDKVRQLLNQLQFRGELSSATHSARRENPVCGDITQIQLLIQDRAITECRFQANGCAAAIAAAAALPHLIQGKSVEHASELNVETLLDFLEGLPRHKEHGAELAITTLRSALESPIADRDHWPPLRLPEV